MDLVTALRGPGGKPITCVEMHTTGEPTRVVIDGYPALVGTLNEQRAQARREFDHIRKRLMHEPRGHFDMYGAVLRQYTELTGSGEAHIGVFFLTNDGYSTMCGHATIALGRLLIDTHDAQVFPQRSAVQIDAAAKVAHLNLHAPCGLVKVEVPVTDGGSRSDPSRLVAFYSVPSFATAIGETISIPPDCSWPQLRGRTDVTADFAYGGAYYCIVPAEALGFPSELNQVDLDALNRATRNLTKAIVRSGKESLLYDPVRQERGELYSIMVVDKMFGPRSGDPHAELGLCFFAQEQIDRSPTGSCVSARVALAYAKGECGVDWKQRYHSVVSSSQIPDSAFLGSVAAVETVFPNAEHYPQIQVKVEGFGYYTGTSTFTVEDSDPLGDSGFLFKNNAHFVPGDG